LKLAGWIEMFVTKHPNRYLVNMSHGEMDALRRVISAGMLLLEGEDGDGLWANFSPGEKMVIGRWRRRDPMQPTGPRSVKKRRRTQPVKTPLSSVA
jgi:hypothetical protein